MRGRCFKAGQPCAGSFTCAGNQDIAQTPIAEVSEADNVFWCAEGVVQVATMISAGAV